jgi:hypothetical protein
MSNNNFGCPLNVLFPRRRRRRRRLSRATFPLAPGVCVPLSLSLSLSSLFLFVVVFQTMMEKMKEERVLSLNKRTE